MILGGVIAAMLLSSASGAQAPSTGPVIEKKLGDHVFFAGAYGEEFNLEPGWRIRSNMKGDAEIVDFYLPYDLDKIDSDPLNVFDPDPSFFRPENYSRYRLLRLTIQPRRDQSLDRIRENRVRELRAAGIRFKIVVVGEKDILPGGSFIIESREPYFLREIYAATPSFYCVLTRGVDVPPSSVISSFAWGLEADLRRWLMRQVPPSKRARPGEEYSDETVIAYFFQSPGFQRLISLLMACGLLALIPTSWPYFRRISWAARNGLKGALAAFIAGEAMGALMAPMPWMGPAHSITLVVILIEAAVVVGSYRLYQKPAFDARRPSLRAAFIVGALLLLLSLPGLPGSDASKLGLLLQSGFASAAVGLVIGCAYGLFYRGPASDTPKRGLEAVGAAG